MNKKIYARFPWMFLAVLIVFLLGVGFKRKAVLKPETPSKIEKAIPADSVKNAPVKLKEKTDFS